MSHTPGPWKFEVVDETDSFLGCKRLDGGNGSTIIDLSDEWTGYRECGQDLQMTISKEDAALIAAAPENAKCSKYYSKEDDGLAQEWRGVCWMNPPYGRGIGAWVRKAFETAESGRGMVVCLLPARTDTSWWHDYAMKGEIVFLRGRLKFGEAKNSAPFPSAIVIFGESLEGRKKG